MTLRADVAPGPPKAPPAAANHVQTVAMRRQRQKLVHRSGDCILKSTAGPPEAALVQPLSLRLNFSWIAAGNAVEMVCQWGLVVALAHLGSLEMIGVVVLAFAVCAPVNALAQLGLRGAVITDARREYRFGDYLAVRLVTSAAAMLVILGIALTAGFAAQTALVILAVGLGELLKSVSDVLHALMQQRERMDRIAISLMVRGPATLALLVLGVWATESLVWGTLAFPLVAAAMLFGYDLPNGSRIIGSSAGARGDLRRPACRDNARPDDASLRPRWHARTMLRLAWLTLPLGIVLTLVALGTSVPRFMVDHYLGRRALGLFVSILYLGVVGTRVVSAVGQSAGPRLAKYHAAGDSAAYCRLLGKLLVAVAAGGTGMVLLAAVAGGPILGLLYDADYTAHLELAVYLMLVAAVTYLTIPLGIAVEAMRRFKTHMVIRGTGVVVLLGLLPGLIQSHGLWGAATAMLLSSGISVLGCAVMILRSLGRNSPSCQASLLVKETYAVEPLG